MQHSVVSLLELLHHLIFLGRHGVLALKALGLLKLLLLNELVFDKCACLAAHHEMERYLLFLLVLLALVD